MQEWKGVELICCIISVKKNEHMGDVMSGNTKLF